MMTLDQLIARLTDLRNNTPHVDPAVAGQAEVFLTTIRTGKDHFWTTEEMVNLVPREGPFTLVIHGSIGA